MAIRVKSALGLMAAALILGPAVVNAQEPERLGAAPPPAVTAGIEQNVAEGPDTEEDEDAPKQILGDALLGKWFTEKTRFFVNGYIVQSYTLNGWSPNNRINGPITFNDRSNDYLMNQLYLSAGRAVDTEKAFDVGGKVDWLYGTDAIFTQALGLDNNIATQSPLYRLAIPQLYGEIYTNKIGKGLSIKGGHFYTIIGYEVVTTPDNFFTTLPYTFQYGEPFTHTGGLANLKLSDQFALNGGVVLGWDNWIDNNNAASFLGGATWTPNDKLNVTYNLITGPEQDEKRNFQAVRGTANQSLNRYLGSFVLQYKITDSLSYVLQSDHGIQNGAGFGGITVDGVDYPALTKTAMWYGVNQYLFYDINKKLSVGLRAEWFRDQDGFRVGEARYTSLLGPQSQTFPFPTSFSYGYLTGSGSDYYALTLGLNYKINNNIIIRPDMRYDFQTRDNDTVTAAFKDNTRSQQFITSLNLIVRY